MRSTRSLWLAAIAAIAMIVTSAATPPAAHAQSLSSPSFSNSSSADELVNGFFDNPTYQRSSATQTVPPVLATTFTTRYYGNASADCGAACGGRTETLNSNYTVSWTATAPNIYRMQIDTRRTAGLTVVDEGTGNGQATMGGLTCTPSGGTVVSGDCALANPADANSNSTVMVNVNQTNSMIVCGQSLGAAKAHSMNYVWTQSAVTPGTGFISINSDEGAVRLGANNGDGSNTAANYPGAGGLARTQSNDGHFTTVTITNLCGNGVIDSCGANSEQCDEGANNGTPGSCCNSNCTLKASGTSCRGAAGDCDAAETCDGVNGDCPADVFLPSSTVCRASSAGELCDAVEQCTGSGPNCPPDAVLPNGTTCRGVAGGCDVAETCDGVTKLCPADAFVPSGTTCRASGGVCDVVEQCSGSGPACPADAKSSAQCRASGGVCDLAENCDGVNDDCPADAKSTAVCRAAGDVCDVAEVCDGVNDTCPADGVASASTVCRASSVGEVCDIAELCDGTNKTCPPDAVEPATTVCRATSVGETCDVAENCDGTSKTCPADAKVPSGTICRSSGGVCDVAETCDGVNDNCPADGFAADGTNCEDGNFCNGTQTCTAGVCGGGTSPCSMGESCDEGSDLCFSGDCPVNPVGTCRLAGKNRLLIKNKADSSKDKLVWKWTKGAGTTQGDFGDPVMGSATYALCFYAGATPTLIQGLSVPPAGGKWAAIGTKGYKYKDTGGTNDGITKIIVKGGGPNKSKALVKGKGINLPDFDSNLPVAAGDLPMIVQLRNSQTGICWTGSFSTPKKNQADQFNAKAP